MDSSSSVKLLLNGVGRDVEMDRGQEYGYLEGVACAEQGAQVGLAGLVHQKYHPKTRPAMTPMAMAKRACFICAFVAGAGAPGWLGALEFATCVDL